VQPPFVQLNGPYPSLYYLRSFLEERGFPVIVRDHSIGLFETIFCREGLRRIFADVRGVKGSAPAGNALVERFLGDEGRWLSTIDRTVDFLRGTDREWGHFIALANGVFPDGVRFFQYIAEQGGGVCTDEAPILAGRLLADIADFITSTLDENFSLIRYAPSTAGAGFRDFSDAQKAMNGYIMRNFYRPLLEREWQQIGELSRGRFILGLTLPFPGCLAGALVCAESAKKRFGGETSVILGGGYVNTELRFIEDEQIFDYTDYLSFDRGYSSLCAIIEREFGSGNAKNSAPLYKTMYRNQGNIVTDASINADGNNDTDGKRMDDENAASVFPDYTGIDFSRYIRPVDDANPMHRLWSDGRWLKAYAAHGCYWHNCAFCDVNLDYIRCYKPVESGALFRHLVQQAAATGIRGVHLVDEACPPASLLRLALLNREAGLPLLFWGNIRFEKAFGPDTAAILAAGGVIGLSAGIEIATERGLERTGKGIGLAGIVSACAAFKEAGILVHAYLIYGWWDEADAEIIDSAETLRQLFAQGLLDSAFWHQFTLTVHSRVYAEKMAGLHPALKPSGGAAGGVKGKKLFALNDISFAGTERFNRFAAPLDSLLAQWMRGGNCPLAEAFPFTVPQPAIAPNAVELLLDEYTFMRERDRAALPRKNEQALFLGSLPFAGEAKQGAVLRWRWRFGECVLRLRGENTARAEQIAALLAEAAKGRGTDAMELFTKLETMFTGKAAGMAKQVWKSLRKQGLMVYSNRQ
jgi:hypothetical protein